MCSKIWSLFHWPRKKSKIVISFYASARYSCVRANERVKKTNECYGLTWNWTGCKVKGFSILSACSLHLVLSAWQVKRKIIYICLIHRLTTKVAHSCVTLWICALAQLLNTASRHARLCVSSAVWRCVLFLILMQPLQFFLWSLLVLHEPLWCLGVFLTMY